MNKYESLFDTLCADYAAGFSRRSIDKLEKMRERGMRHLAAAAPDQFSGFYRRRIRGWIQDYQLAQAGRSRSLIKRMYIRHEMIFLQRQISNLWRVYRILMSDRYGLQTGPTECFIADQGSSSPQRSSGQPRHKMLRAGRIGEGAY